MERIRVVLVEDNREYAAKVNALLARVPFIEVVDSYTTGRRAVAGIMAKRPDVALVDLGLPDISGEEVIWRLKERGSKTEALALTVQEEDAHLFGAVRAGAKGYLIKGEASLAKLAQAIQDLRNGEVPMSPGLARRILEYQTTAKRVRTPHVQELTPREREVLECCAKGFPPKQAAQILGISYENVRGHLKSIYDKLQVHSLVEAVAVFRGEKSV